MRNSKFTKIVVYLLVFSFALSVIIPIITLAM